MYRIGVDLGGTNIAAGLVDETYKIVCKKSVPTGADRAPELIVADMGDLCRTLCAEAKVDLADVVSVGIASPGIANHDTGVVEYANNLPFINFPIASMLSEQLDGKPVYIENDANAAALGEAVAGAAKGTHDSVMITLGTGVGGGVIIGGKVFSGFNYAGAELGHIVIEVGGRQCGCGSAEFAIAFAFACVVIYDAMGVRRAAGEQAKVINQLTDSLFKNLGETKIVVSQLKELLGHTPVEVFGGIILGVTIATLFKGF